jgi:hypothetical protein
MCACLTGGGVRGLKGRAAACISGAWVSPCTQPLRMTHYAPPPQVQSAASAHAAIHTSHHHHHHYACSTHMHTCAHTHTHTPLLSTHTSTRLTHPPITHHAHVHIAHAHAQYNGGQPRTRTRLTATRLQWIFRRRLCTHTLDAIMVSRTYPDIAHAHASHRQCSARTRTRRSAFRTRTSPMHTHGARVAHAHEFRPDTFANRIFTHTHPQTHTHSVIERIGQTNTQGRAVTANHFFPRS